MRFTLLDLARVRALVAVRASAVGLDPDRGADLVSAVNELATNSIKHGGGSGELRIWTSAEQLTCEIHDAGHITDALAGQLPPDFTKPGEWGLWLVNQLCDLVQIQTGSAGTTVRAHITLDRQSPARTGTPESLGRPPTPGRQVDAGNAVRSIRIAGGATSPRSRSSRPPTATRRRPSISRTARSCPWGEHHLGHPTLI